MRRICLLISLVALLTPAMGRTIPDGILDDVLGDFFNREDENITWLPPSINLSDYKKGWWERFRHRFNESFIEEEWRNWTKKWEEKFQNLSEKVKRLWRNATKNFEKAKMNHSFIGGMEYENGYCIGKFVKFLYDEGDIVDYTILREDNITVFDFVRIEGFSPTEEPTVHGAVWRVRGADAEIEVHDNPLALLKIRTKTNATIEFNLANDIHAEKYENITNIIRIHGEIDGRIIMVAKGEAEISNESVRISLESPGSVLFMVDPLPDVSVNIQSQVFHEERISRYIGNKKIGARLLLQFNNSDEMIFSDMNVSCKVMKGRIKVVVNATGEGKAIILDVRNDVLNISKEIVVKIDNQSIQIAGSFEEVVNFTGEDPAKYYILNGTNGLQIVVCIPRFSTHTIDIIESEVTSVEAGEKETPGPGMALLAISIVLVALLVRRFRK